MMWIKCRCHLHLRNADRVDADIAAAMPNRRRIQPPSEHGANEIAHELTFRLRLRIGGRRLSAPRGSSSSSRLQTMERTLAASTRIGDRRLGRRPVRRPSAARCRLGRRGFRARRRRPRRSRHRHRHARGAVRRDAPDRDCRRCFARDRRRGPDRSRPRWRCHPRAAGARRHQRLVAHLASAAAGAAGRLLRRRQGARPASSRKPTASPRSSTTARAPKAICWSRPTDCIPRFARNSFPALAPRYAGYVAWRGVVEAASFRPNFTT